MEVWINLVQSVGFPVVVTIFLLVRFEKSLNNIDKSLIKICERLGK